MDPKEFDQRQERVTELLGTVDETLDTIASQVTLLGNLHSPKAPAAILAHTGSAGASQWVETRCGRLKTASETLKAMAKKARDTAETLSNTEFAIGHLCRDIAQPQLDLDLGKPLVQSVAQAAAEAGHPVPAATPPSKPVVPWQKIRVWREDHTVRLGAVELHGPERFDLINDAIMDGGPTDPRYTTVPPWLAPDGAVQLPSGEPLASDMVLLVDDTLMAWEDVKIDDTGLGAAMSQEVSSEHVSWPEPQPPGRAQEQRRAKGTHLTLEDLAHLDGVPVYEIISYHKAEGWTYYTTERALPELEAGQLIERLQKRPQTETPAPEPGLGVLDPDPTDAESAPAATDSDPDLAVACPLTGCEQPVGHSCVNYKGYRCAVHADRRKAAQKARGGEKGAKPKKQKKGA